MLYVIILCSLGDNSIGVEGARAIAEALKVNATITKIEWVWHPPNPVYIYDTLDRDDDVYCAIVMNIVYKNMQLGE
jgi:hypothetical protein